MFDFLALAFAPVRARPPLSAAKNVFDLAFALDL